MQSLLRVRMTSVLRLLLIMIILSFGCSLLISCASEASACFSNTDCTSCVNLIEDAVKVGEIDTEFNSYAALFAEACSVAEAKGCDVTNQKALDLAQCFAEEFVGCSGFTSC